MLRSKLIPLTLAAVLLGGCVAAPTGTGAGGTVSAKRKAKTVDKSKSTNDDDEFPEDDGSDEGGDDTGNTDDTATGGDTTATDTTTPGDTTATTTTNTGDTTASDTVSPASITAINPPNGGPGTVVTLAGTGFRKTQNTAFKVFFGETEASSATRDSDESITATVPTVSSGSANVTVKFGAVTSNSFAFRQPQTISLNGSNNQVEVGGTLSFPYTVLDTEGNAMTSPNLAWTIEDSTIASVSAMGLVTGVKVGSTKLTANAGSVTGTVTLNVVAAVDTVTSYVGAGTQGSSNGGATTATFNALGELVVAPNGDIWVVDSSADGLSMAVRRINATTQDVSALSLSPNGADAAAPVVDAALAIARVPDAAGGGMAILDGSGVRRVTDDGTVVLVPVSGLSFTGGAIAIGPDGTVYVADTSNNQIKAIGPTGTVTVLAGTSTGDYADGGRSAARFSSPSDLAYISGRLYVADSGNNRIRSINLQATNVEASTYVQTVAGGDTADFADGTGTQARFNLPRGMTFASDGCLYVADANNNRIRRLDINAGQGSADFVTTVAGSGNQGFKNGSYTSAEFSLPTDVVEGDEGELFVTDSGNFRIRRIQLEN